MALDPDAAPQVWLSLGALALLLVVYPFVRRRAKTRSAGERTHDGEASPSASPLT
jgi:GABA permease